MLITIITVCKNPGKSIQKTVESVLTQSFANIEYIVIDGASTDGTAAWLKSFNSPDPSINSERPSLSKRGRLMESFKFISEPDTGIYNAMNKGINLATGKYLLFLNAGDYLVNNDIILEVVKNIDDNVQNCGIYFGNIISEDPETGNRYNSTNRLININSVKLFFWCIPHAASFIKRDLIKHVGGYEEHFKIAGDYDFFLKAYHIEKAVILHIPVTVSVFGTDGISSKNSRLLRSEDLQIIKRYYGTFAKFLYTFTLMMVFLRFFYKVWLRFEKNS